MKSFHIRFLYISTLYKKTFSSSLPFLCCLKVLKTKSVQDIMDQKDIGIEVIRDKFEECSGHKEPGKPADDIVSLASVVPISIAFETIASREERWANLLTTVTTTNLQAANSICRWVC